MHDTSIAEAQRLLDRGAVAEAAALLERTADAGSAEAAMLLAVCYLRGERVSRDLVRARAHLRRAVGIGHVDAALMEVALTANGSGAPADWARALDLLGVAANADPVAAEQLRLLRAMELDARGMPRTASPSEPVSTAPRITRFRRFFSPAECAHVAGVTGALLAPARVIDPATGQWRAHPVRTSDDAAIGPAQEDLVIRALNLRIAAASGTRVERGEALTVLRYRPGQQFRPHLDTIAGATNQRRATMLVYLNEGYGGGETHFPDANVTITPRGGDAILFENLRDDGSPDPATRHAGLPVTRGVKWLATRWIRAGAVDPWVLP
ncbi:2OG-Fe(II) oxygenase [Sphingomonas sp.]|uniref:2OG-Fe(II) oxygenase n=1 Tax=Sphingomonas sp. TaxID=28214 RepID=UPI0035C864D8